MTEDHESDYIASANGICTVMSNNKIYTDYYDRLFVILLDE